MTSDVLNRETQNAPGGASLAEGSGLDVLPDRGHIQTPQAHEGDPRHSPRQSGRCTGPWRRRTPGPKDELRTRGAVRSFMLLKVLGGTRRQQHSRTTQLQGKVSGDPTRSPQLGRILLARAHIPKEAQVCVIMWLRLRVAPHVPNPVSFYDGIEGGANICLPLRYQRTCDSSRWRRRGNQA